MTDATRFKSPEEVREYLRSEWSRTDGSIIERKNNVQGMLHYLQSNSSGINLAEVVAPFIEQWRKDNPQVAQDLDHTLFKFVSVVRHAVQRLEFMFTQISAGIDQWIRDNPEAYRKMVGFFEILASDGLAAGWQKRHQEEGVAIPFDESVQLAYGLMAFRIPFVGDRGPDASNLNTIYDYEMRAIYVLRDDRLRELIEGAQSSPLDFRALQEVLSYFLETERANSRRTPQLESASSCRKCEISKFKRLGEVHTQTKFAMN